MAAIEDNGTCMIVTHIQECLRILDMVTLGLAPQPEMGHDVSGHS